MFKIDMHIHTELGKDSIIRPEDLVPRAIEEGLDAICVTEHHDYALSEPLQQISLETGFPIFRGLEYKAMEGHLLIYGVPAGRGDLPPQMPMQTVIDWVLQRNGIAVPAHPYQPDLFGRCLGDRLRDLQHLTAIETLNGSATRAENSAAEKVAAERWAAGIGGSDAHGPAGIGKAYTIFPEPVTSMAQLVTAIRNKTTSTALRQPR